MAPEAAKSSPANVLRAARGRHLRATHIGALTIMVAQRDWRTDGSNTFQEGSPNHASRTMSTGGPAVFFSPEAESQNARAALPHP
eukprot:8928818-Lingulodinium_polyedra.AAC.1